MTSVLVLNGPNLGRLGSREPEKYGSTTHDELAAQAMQWGSDLGLEVVVRQTDDEAELVGWLHGAIDAGDQSRLPDIMGDAWLSDVTLYGSADYIREQVEESLSSGVTPILVPSSTSGGMAKAITEVFAIFE